MSFWRVVTRLRTPWAWVHSILSTHAPELIPVPHRIIDNSIANAKAPTSATNKQSRLRIQRASKWRQLFYPNGFGDPDLPWRFYQRLKEIRSQVTKIAEEKQKASEDPFSAKGSFDEQRILDEIPDVNVTLEKAKYDRTHDCFLQLGHFPVINEEVKRDLPEESHAGYFQLVLPASWYEDEQGECYPPEIFEGQAFSSASTTMTEKEIQNLRKKRKGRKKTPQNGNFSGKPICIILAGTGEHGFSRRGQFLAYPLAESGVASIILESPFYGLRKPKHQWGSKLKQLSDLPILGRATIEEARSLIKWIKEHTSFGPIILTGTSMGGLHAAMTASLTPIEVGAVSWLGPTSAAPVFTHGALSGSVDWMAMCRDVTEGKVDFDANYPAGYVESIAFDPENRIEKGLRAYEKEVIEDVQAFIQRDDVNIPRQLKLVAHEELEKASERLDARVEDLHDSEVESDESVNGLESSFKIAQHQITRFLHLTNLLHVPPPLRPEAVTFVAAMYDQYVPPPLQEEEWQSVLQRWKGAKLRWMTGGHVSATLWPLETENHKATILNCIETLK